MSTRKLKSRLTELHTHTHKKGKTPGQAACKPRRERSKQAEAWWSQPNGPTRSHPEPGSETLARR